MAGPIKAEIWHGEFSGSRGHEQKKDRPCLIWKDLDHCGMAIVIPFTGSIDKDTLPHTYLVEPSLSNGLGKESIALIFQITSVDKKRLIRKLGVLGQKEFDAIGDVLKDMLDI